jgi:hypothetical protein
MKNTTLGRSKKTGLAKNQGVAKSTARVSQTGDGADFAFNGQMGTGVNRMHGRDSVCVNPYAHLVKNPDMINHGLYQSQRKGTASDSTGDRMESIGPSATKDPNRLTVATASQGHPIESGYGKVPHVANPDKIYITKAAR